jgi:zinc transporter ZupT
MIYLWNFINSDLMFWIMLAIAGAILVILILALYPEPKIDDKDVIDFSEHEPDNETP